ncbi:MAG: flavin reductase family protein [Hyphomonadaceae bacterium]
MTEEISEPRLYRQALGAFATGVAIVTAGSAENGYAAITINSLTSVSLSPRLMLWCLADSSDRYKNFAEADHFGISVLAPPQADLAARFAVQGAKLIDPHEVEWLEHAPVLPDGVARFACRTYDRRSMGDHLVITGEVLAYEKRGEGEALTYFRGKFGKLAAG